MKDCKLVGKTKNWLKGLIVGAVLLLAWVVARLLIVKDLFQSNMADVVAAMCIAGIFLYFAGKYRNVEAEEEDENVLAEAPVLAQPVASSTATTTNTGSEAAKEPEKGFAALDYRDFQSIRNAQEITDDQKIALVERANGVNKRQQEIDKALSVRDQKIAQYNATFGAHTTMPDD